jgi:glutathione S-transferase
VLVEDDGAALADSNAILHYLEVAYPEKPLLPRDPKAAREALAIMTAVDVAMNAVVDLGTRLDGLQGDAAWPEVKAEAMGRAQAAIAFVAENPPRGEWSAAHIFAYSATRWALAWPGRVASSPQVAKIVKLGFTLPESLVAWSKPFDERADVRAIYG